MFFFLFLSKAKIKNHKNGNQTIKTQIRVPLPQKSQNKAKWEPMTTPPSVLGLHPAQTCANFACAATVCMSSYVPHSIVPGSHCFLGVIHHL